MSEQFFIKRGDTAPSLSYTLSPVVDLTGADVVFSMRVKDRSPALIARATAVIVDAAAAVVRYDWAAGDTDTAGRLEAEFEVTLPDGSIATYPNYGYILVRIGEDIG